MSNSKKINRSLRITEELNTQFDEFKENFCKTYHDISNNDLMELLLNSAKKEYAIKTSSDIKKESEQTKNVKGYNLADQIIKATIKYNLNEMKKRRKQGVKYKPRTYYITISALEKQCGINRQSAINAINHNKKLIEEQASIYSINKRTNLKYRGKKDDNGRQTIINQILKFGKIKINK